MTARPSQPSKRHLSEAIYEQLMTDEDAPPSVRLAAAQAYDAIENGRPGSARPVNVDDVSSLDDDQLERLYHALMRRIEVRRPGFLKAMMRDIVDQMLARHAALPQPVKPNRFQRGPLAGTGPQVPRWPPAPAKGPAFSPSATAIRSDSSGLSAAPAASGGEKPTPPFSAAVIAESPPADNVIPMPSVARAPAEPVTERYTYDRRTRSLRKIWP